MSEQISRRERVVEEDPATGRRDGRQVAVERGQEVPFLAGRVEAGIGTVGHGNSEVSHTGIAVDTEVLERNADGDERDGGCDVDRPDAGASSLLEREPEECAGDDHGREEPDRNVDAAVGAAQCRCQPCDCRREPDDGQQASSDSAVPNKQEHPRSEQSGIGDELICRRRRPQVCRECGERQEEQRKRGCRRPPASKRRGGDEQRDGEVLVREARGNEGQDLANFSDPSALTPNFRIQLHKLVDRSDASVHKKDDGDEHAGAEARRPGARLRSGRGREARWSAAKKQATGSANVG